MGQKFTRHKVFLNGHSLYVVVVNKPKDWSVRQKVESQIFTRQEVTLNQHSLLRVTAQIVVNAQSNPPLPSFPLLNPPNPLILFSKVSSRCDFTGLSRIVLCFLAVSLAGTSALFPVAHTCSRHGPMEIMSYVI